MKKYITLFLSVALFASCSDWLDVTPKGSVLDEDLFSNEDGIHNATNGLYREMISTSLYGGNLSQTTVEMMAHVYTYPPIEHAGGSYGDTNTFWALAHYEYTKDDKAKDRYTDIWKKGYETILHINKYIQNLNESSAIMPEGDKNILLGEAYGMRAYLHFDLFRLFGPIWKEKNGDKVLPYNDKPGVVINHTGYEETEYFTADKFMELLLRDIRTAEDLLKNDPIINQNNSITDRFDADDYFHNRNRRMNYYAVKGLEARVRQYRGEYALAAQAAKVITDQVGEPGSTNKRFSWVELDKVTGDYNNYIFFTEVIFGINNTAADANGENWYNNSLLASAYVVDVNNLILNILYPGITLEGMTDIRSKQWVVSNVTDYSGADYSEKGTYKSKKYAKFSFDDDDPRVIHAIKDLQPLMRISEMYYIQAEAALQEGLKGEAATLLNTVLDHRGLTEQYFLSEVSADTEFTDLIEKEYYREFSGEGQIFFFHKRRVSPKIFKGYEEGYVDLPDPSKNYVVPIPESEKNI